jgi:hypothetical protein
MTESYRNLIAWQKSKAPALDIYRCTPTFAERVRSIPVHARGSLLELENQVEIARELEYLNEAAYSSFLRKTEEPGRILNGLLNRLQMELEGVS